MASTTVWRHCLNGPNTRHSPNHPIQHLGPQPPPRPPGPMHSHGEPLIKFLSQRAAVSPGARVVGCPIVRGGLTCLGLPTNVICRRIDGAKDVKPTSRQDEQKGDSDTSPVDHGIVVAHRWTFLVMGGWMVWAICSMTTSDLGIRWIHHIRNR